MDRRRAYVDRLVSWSPVLLLGALAALTYWLDAQVQPPPVRIDGSNRHDPDVFLDNFRAITFDRFGKPRETLAASKANHFPDDQTAEVMKPVLSLTEPDKPTITLTADQGKLSADREHGYFTGNVRVHRDAEAGDAANKDNAGPLTLTTSYLHVIPKRSLALSDKAVTIEDPHGIIRGTGMEIDLNAKTVKLDSHVTGSFQPQEHPK